MKNSFQKENFIGSRSVFVNIPKNSKTVFFLLSSVDLKDKDGNFCKFKNILFCKKELICMKVFLRNYKKTKVFHFMLCVLCCCWGVEYNKKKGYLYFSG